MPIVFVRGALCQVRGETEARALAGRDSTTLTDVKTVVCTNKWILHSVFLVCSKGVTLQHR